MKAWGKPAACAACPADWDRAPERQDAAYALLDHNGDYAKAAAALRIEGYGDPAAQAVSGVDLSGFKVGGNPVSPTGEVGEDEGPLRLGELIRRYPRMRLPVIHGLLREGEIGRPVLWREVLPPQTESQRWLSDYELGGGAIFEYSRAARRPISSPSATCSARWRRRGSSSAASRTS